MKGVLFDEHVSQRVGEAQSTKGELFTPGCITAGQHGQRLYAAWTKTWRLSMDEAHLGLGHGIHRARVHDRRGIHPGHGHGHDHAHSQAC